MRFRLKRIMFAVLSTLVCCGALSSCQGLVYDNEGDCDVHYRVKFRYDRNLLFADAFAHEVKAVTLYVLDPATGAVVLSKTESGDVLSTGDYEMELDLQPGKYDLLAWCQGDDCKSFIIGDATSKKDLTCAVVSKTAADGSAYVDSRLDGLYHGYVADVDFTKDEGTVVAEVPLTKDTNYFTVILQHISGSALDKDKFSFAIVEDNGLMDWDNSLMSGGEVTYKAWSVESGSAEVEKVDTRAASLLNLAVAEISTGRLMYGRSPRLVVTNNENGATVLSVPVVDFALLVKGKYNQSMDEQEYLDRQDEYNMVFFLDDGDRWINSFIYVNSWKVVLQQSNL
jgi:hypothetical protein